MFKRFRSMRVRNRKRVWKSRHPICHNAYNPNSFPFLQITKHRGEKSTRGAKTYLCIPKTQSTFKNFEKIEKKMSSKTYHGSSVLTTPLRLPCGVTLPNRIAKSAMTVRFRRFVFAFLAFSLTFSLSLSLSLFSLTQTHTHTQVFSLSHSLT